MNNESYTQKHFAYSLKCKPANNIKSFKTTAIFLFVLMVSQTTSVLAVDPLVASMTHNVFENTIDIEVTLDNAQFSSLFLTSTLIVTTNTNNVKDDRSMSLDKKTIHVTLTILESVQDLEINVKLPSCCVSTQEQLVLSQDITFTFIAGTFLPNCPRLNLQSAVSFIQDSGFFIFLRMIPIHVILFTHIQGLIVVLLSDIYLPQKFYETLRTYCSLIFQSINPWQPSNNFTPDIQPKTLFGSRLETSSTTLHISQIGFQENFFAQTIGPVMILCTLWGAWYFCKLKRYNLVQLQIINLIAILHKTTLMLFTIFMFQQIRMLGYVWNDPVSVFSVIAAFTLLGYFILISYLIVKLTLRSNIPGEDQSIEERAFYKLASSMRCYFYLPSQYDNGIIQDHQQQQKQLSQISKKNLSTRGNLLVKWFPLLGIAFKIWISFNLVFFQGTGYFQMVMLLISYGLYGVLTFRYFVGQSSCFLTLKMTQQASFIFLLIFSLVNHIIIENLLSSVPYSGGSTKLSDDSYDSLSAIQIIQFLLLGTYVCLSLLNKFMQFQAFLHSPKLRLYDSQQRLCLSKKQITQISHVVQEMMAQKKQTQITEELLPQAKMIVWKAQQSNNQLNSKRTSQAIVTNMQKTNNTYCNNDFNKDVQKVQVEQNLDSNKNSNNNNNNNNPENIKNRNTTKTISDKRNSNQLQQLNNEIQENLSDDNNNNLDENLIQNKYSTIGSQQTITNTPYNQGMMIQQKQLPSNFNSTNNYASKGGGRDSFIKYGASSSPSIIPIVHRLVLKNDNQDGLLNQSQYQSQNGINYNLNESDVDAFSSIQRVLNVQRPYVSKFTETSLLEALMLETTVKLIELSREQHQNIVEFIRNQQNSKYRASKLQYYPGDDSVSTNGKNMNDSFEKAIRPVSLLIRNETIRKYKHSYGRFNDQEADFSNFIENIQEATIIEKDPPIQISTKYSQRNFIISQNSFERFDELVKLCSVNSTGAMSITTRIFFDLEPYYLNSQIQFNQHASFSYLFPKK